MLNFVRYLVSNHTHPVVTDEKPGFMSPEMKQKLDSIEYGAGAPIQVETGPGLRATFDAARNVWKIEAVYE